jgi:hypothetical protein
MATCECEPNYMPETPSISCAIVDRNWWSTTGNSVSADNRQGSLSLKKDPREAIRSASVIYGRRDGPISSATKSVYQSL